MDVSPRDPPQRVKKLMWPHNSHTARARRLVGHLKFDPVLCRTLAPCTHCRQRGRYCSVLAHSSASDAAQISKSSSTASLMGKSWERRKTPGLDCVTMKLAKCTGIVW